MYMITVLFGIFSLGTSQYGPKSSGHVPFLYFFMTQPTLDTTGWTRASVSCIKGSRSEGQTSVVTARVGHMAPVTVRAKHVADGDIIYLFVYLLIYSNSNWLR